MKKLLILSAAFVLTVAAKADFTPGNLVIVRVGDGTASLGSSATSVNLLEFTTAGSLVQTLAMPTSASGANQALTLQGSATSEGFLKRSTDGQYLTLAGYGTSPGTASPSGATATTVNRVVARVNSSGSIDTTTALTDSNNGSNIRSAASTDGNNIWTTGNAGSGQSATSGTRYTTFGSTTSVRVDTSFGNSRVANVFNGQLYVSSSTGAFLGVSAVGTGLPTTAGSSAVTPLPGMPATGTHSPYDFWFMDASTLYVADDGSAANGGGIQKWTFDGANWSLQYTLLNNGSATTAVRGLTGYVDGSGNANLFGTTGASLIGVVDTGAAASASVLASAGSNFAFRGIAFAPSAVPEPSAFALIALGAVAGLIRRSRKA